jgi:hypothetical protein
MWLVEAAHVPRAPQWQQSSDVIRPVAAVRASSNRARAMCPIVAMVVRITSQNQKRLLLPALSSLVHFNESVLRII